MELQAINLSKEYSGKTVVDKVDIKVLSGKIVGLLGPNGAGKTTFFYMIAGLIFPDSGQVLINKQDITREGISDRARRGLSYLPQEPSIFRRLSVKENILAALEQRKDLNNTNRIQELEELIEKFNLSSFAETLSIKLSGGERRRVEIARSLASKPKFLLLDEPFAGIDPIAVSELKATLQKLKDMKLGILISDHNVRETMQICDTVSILNEGKMVAEGTALEVSENEIVKEVYLGKNFFR